MSNITVASSPDILVTVTGESAIEVDVIQGLPGEQGPAGPAGPTGPTGPTGPAGPNTVSTATTTNITGLIAGNGSTVIGTLTITQTATNTTHRFMGGTRGSAWQINRWTRTTTPPTLTRATQANNPSVTNLTAAWTNRETLTYA